MLLPMLFVYGQRIGEMAPEKEAKEFPDNAWGADIMFGEGGFGLGFFLRSSFSETLTGFVDVSFSESKADQEIERIDPIFGQTYTIGKANRVFLIPLNFGLQYRLFSETITENLRPYLNFGVGPTMVVTTPYEKEFFSAFGDAQAKFAAGGYIGIGANFGLSESNLLGINMRYYYAHLFDEGVENLEGQYNNDIGSFYITINVGVMY